MKEAGPVGLGSRNQDLIAITSTIKIHVIFVNNIQLYTVRAEISMVCKVRGFHGHLLIQRKFNL